MTNLAIKSIKINLNLNLVEIRDQLLAQRICDPSTIPSVSSVNRILRNGGLWTDEIMHGNNNNFQNNTEGGRLTVNRKCQINSNYRT